MRKKTPKQKVRSDSSRAVAGTSLTLYALTPFTASAGKSYIVRSVLPHELISQMTTPDASLAAAVKDEAGSTGGLQADSSGTMLDWKRSTSELANTGLLFVILSLILLNGRTIADGESYVEEQGAKDAYILFFQTNYEPIFVASRSSQVTLCRLCSYRALMTTSTHLAVPEAVK